MRWAACLLLAACSADEVFVEPDYGLERMQHQRRADAYEASAVFADGRVMQTAPEGTVPRSRVVGDPGRTQGHVAGAYVTTLPVALSRPLLERGRDRFEVFCAPCHGVLGDGESIVGKNFPLIAPRSLHLSSVRAYPPGRLYRVITEGYGVMPAYGAQLELEDCWAVVAYVQALELSQGIALSALPEDWQREAGSVLR